MSLRAAVFRDSFIGSLAGDLRTGAYSLTRRPGFALGAIVTLALGLGANAALFSFLDQVLLRPPPGVADPSSLRRIWVIETLRGSQRITQSFDGDLLGPLATALAPDARVGRWWKHPDVRITSDAGTGKIDLMRCDGDYLPLLGVVPQLGRLFTHDEALPAISARVALISDGYWHSQFGGRSDVLGRRIVLNGAPFTIIGVMPPGFHDIELGRVDAWVPLGSMPLPGGGTGFGHAFATILVRLSPGVSDELLEAKATMLFRRLDSDFAADPLARVVSGSIIEARGPKRQPMEVALAARLSTVTVIVLLIAVANVVNLLLARAVARRRELAVRVALGMSRARLVQLLASEGVLLALVAGLAAIWVAGATGSVLRTWFLPNIQFVDDPLHWRVILATLTVSIGAGLIAGSVPALQSSRPDLTKALKGGAQDGVVQRSVLRSWLVATQAGLSLVLLVGAVLFVQSLRNVQNIPLGYDVPRTAIAGVEVDIFKPEITEDALRVARDRIRSLPGAQQVALVWDEPFTSGLIVPFYTATDSTSGDFTTWPTFTPTSADYFKAAGSRFLRGRDFVSPHERAVIINDAMAKRYWPRVDPIGQCMRLRKIADPCFYVVGVVADAMGRHIMERREPHYYVPFDQTGGMAKASYLLIRANPARMAAVLVETRRIFRGLFPDRGPYLRSLDDLLAAEFRPWRLGARLFSIFGALALAVAIAGIVSTVSYSVSQRTHELGVRIALGAQTNQVVREVARRSLRPVVAGIAAGIAGALVAGHLVSSMLYGISARNPLVMIAVAAFLALAAIAAALGPALRASRVDPLVSLRAE